MAIALVKAGTITTVSASTVTPSFGQATTAGNLLVGCISSATTPITITGPSGWLLVVGDVLAAMYIKPNCGSSETAPTFDISPNTANMSASLSEFSGVALTSPTDKTGTASSTSSSPEVITCSTSDTSDSNLVISLMHILTSKSTTVTFTPTWTSSGGTVITLADDGSTKGTNHMWTGAYLLNGHGGTVADSLSLAMTPASGTLGSGSPEVIASFMPPAAFLPSKNKVISQSIQRASLF